MGIEIVCKYCDSKRVIKHGIRRNKNGIKQRYLCKNCNRTFVLEPIKSKYPKYIKRCAKKIYQLRPDLSLRKIRDIIKEIFELDKLHHDTIAW